jgi:HK97 family phage prohead protease
MQTRDFTLKVKALDESGTFTGLASTYGLPADLVGDVVEPGAFKQSIQQQGKGIPLLFAHDQSQPLGLSKISDSASGLVVEGSMVMEDPLAQRVYAHLKAGSIKGLSIGYTIPRGEGKVSYASDGTRTLRECFLHEVSLVAVPCNPRAQVVSVKTLGDVHHVLATLRDASDPEVREHLRGVSAELKRLLKKDALCECDCDECLAGDCVDCSNPDCEDPNCEGSMQTAAAKAEETAALKMLALELKKYSSLASDCRATRRKRLTS